MKEFKQTRKGGSGYIADYINDAGGETSDYVMHIAAAIVPPIGFIPGYYLILGLQFDQTPKGLFKLIFIKENENTSRNELLRLFFDDAVKYKVEMVYADRDGKFGFFRNLHNEAIKKKARWQLLPAPSAEDVLYGMSLLNEYKNEKAFNRPDNSIFVGQLRNIGLQDLSDSQAIKQYFDAPEHYVFHVVRYILAGIERDITPNAEVGKVYDLETQRFFKPDNNNQIQQTRESGFFV